MTLIVVFYAELLSQLSLGRIPSSERMRVRGSWKGSWGDVGAVSFLNEVPSM